MELVKIPNAQAAGMDWENAVMQISLFGGLTITVGDIRIKAASTRSHQLWSLLEYLIALRRKAISQDELFDVLWGETDIENPASALKNLVYRVRSVFASYGIPYAKQTIVYSGGSYQWNNALPCTVDIELFEELYKKASNPSQPPDYRVEIYLQAVNLYKGDFLSVSGYKSWVVPVSNYYKSLYFKCVYEVLGLLAEQARFQEVELICNQALMIDQFEENAHKYLILALTKQGQQNRAIAHYKHVTDLFMRELGVKPSASLRNLYRQIAKATHSVEIEIGIILQDLKESEAAEGAFYCEYEVFKNIYQVQARAAPRSGYSVFISLLTLTDEKGGVPAPDTCKKAMNNLFRVIQGNTRSYDVFARFSASQYVLLLPTMLIENCKSVIGRIIKIYSRNFCVHGTEVHAKIQPMDFTGVEKLD